MGRERPSPQFSWKTIAGADPAANAEVSITVPAAHWYEVLGVYLPLVQGITQTPLPILVFDDGTNTFAEIYGATAAQPVSTTAAYTFLVDAPGPAALVGATPDIKGLAPLPEGLVLPPGYRIRTNTLGKGANTDYGVPRLWVIDYVQP